MSDFERKIVKLTPRVNETAVRINDIIMAVNIRRVYSSGMTTIKEERIVASLKKGVPINTIRILQGVTNREIHDISVKYGLNIQDKRMKMWSISNNKNIDGV